MVAPVNSHEILQTAEPACTATQGHANRPNRILLVDDDILIREPAAKALSSSGYQVDTAEDGACGWEALHAGSYDLLITDNSMPKSRALNWSKSCVLRA